MFLAASSLPFTIWLLKNFIDQVPRELEEAAAIEGTATSRSSCASWSRSRLPGILVTSLVAFINAWGAFVIPLVLNSNPNDTAGLDRDLPVPDRERTDPLRRSRRVLDPVRRAGRRPLPDRVAPHLRRVHVRRRYQGMTPVESGDAMATIGFDSVYKLFGEVVAVDDLTLDIRDGEFLVLVGPSGCGKTTSLRMLAGFERADLRDDLDRRRVAEPRAAAAPRPRDGLPELRALPAHDRVQEPRLRHEGAARAALGGASRVEEVARLLDIEALLDRRPSELSGGQRQRVALGRALLRSPRAFLMDEPLSNLDAALRVQMRVELKHLHERLSVTTVYVTHDQVEAMTMGDRIAIMNDGRLQQADTPEAIYVRPANLFVAGFIGSPEDEPRERTRHERRRTRRASTSCGQTVRARGRARRCRRTRRSRRGRGRTPRRGPAPRERCPRELLDAPAGHRGRRRSPSAPRPTSCVKVGEQHAHGPLPAAHRGRLGRHRRRRPDARAPPRLRCAHRAERARGRARRPASAGRRARRCGTRLTKQAPRRHTVDSASPDLRIVSRNSLVGEPLFTSNIVMEASA